MKESSFPSILSILVLFSLLSLLLTDRQSLFADSTSSVTEREIHHLIDYIGESQCEFYRNGKWYDAKKAQAHIVLKYNHARDRGQIGTTEEFIDKAASSSSLTGQPYRVKCAKKRSEPNAVWLKRELARYRSTIRMPIAPSAP